MSIHETTSINAPVDKVVQAYASEDFARHVSQQAGVQFESFSVDGDTAGAFTVTTVRSVGGDKIPGFAQRFIKNGVTLTQKDLFKAPGADGSRDVETSVSAGAVPVSANLTQKLTAEGEKTQVALEGEVKANIPLVGKKLAQAAEPYMSKALTLQSREAEHWINK
ncbi:hypothetical protein A5N15_00945 [Rothia kristinae]|uniref:DUF2505 domain-containing protein n=1 Tax=Rothia kristinae TaxID=37923 RepID=A0A199Q354_9MICC|nr:DUF2505 domain-containing protein [Rothia kristinae]OAX52933.1 hypothetical protein AN277_0200780 [Rothia kristinae]OAX67758.1 hypothetical protein A5N15_00945 [Rothia kristinae]